MEEGLINKIVRRLNNLNESICEDTRNLGPGYQIGHSYFCPNQNEQPFDEEWYATVIESEIKPLLEEYWFDNRDIAEKHIEGLLAN